MDRKQSDEQLTDAEADKRMNDALRRALTTPPKQHGHPTPKTEKAASKRARPKK